MYDELWLEIPEKRGSKDFIIIDAVCQGKDMDRD